VSRSGLSGLVGFALLLALVIAAELASGTSGSDDASAAPTPRSSDIAAAAPANPAPGDSIATILARPLFTASRQPPPGAAMTAAASAADPSLPRLAGIIIDGTVRLAIFQPANSGKPIAVAEGGQIAGRKIVAIAAAEVVALGPDGEEHLRPLPDTSLARADMVAPETPVPPPDPNRHIDIPLRAPRDRAGATPGKLVRPASGN
jgi:hypothetical protein